MSFLTVIEDEVTEWDEFTGRVEAVESVEIRPGHYGERPCSTGRPWAFHASSPPVIFTTGKFRFVNKSTAFSASGQVAEPQYKTLMTSGYNPLPLSQLSGGRHTAPGICSVRKSASERTSTTFILVSCLRSRSSSAGAEGRLIVSSK